MPRKFFAAIVIGEDEQSFGFVKQKEMIAKELGIDFRIYRLPAELNNDKARREVWKIAKHKTCGGVIVQLPLPAHLNAHYVINAIPREKDVDVLSERAFGAFCNGRDLVLPPAVGAMKKVFTGTISKAAVVGLGTLVGKPIAIWLMKQASEICLLDKGSDMCVLQDADLVILGVGKAGIVKPNMLKEGAGVIDFGYSVVDGKLAGDLDASSSEALSKLSFYTPTPGGMGPILVAQLFENFYTLNMG